MSEGREMTLDALEEHVMAHMLAIVEDGQEPAGVRIEAARLLMGLVAERRNRPPTDRDIVNGLIRHSTEGRR
jgi:hypothetical protein